MLNQLPKNLNLSSTPNEKHLNLLDNLPEIKNTQDSSVTNFILVLTVFFVMLSSVVSYLNISNNILSTSTDQETQDNLNFIASQEITALNLKQDIKFLSDFKNKNNLIKNKYASFFQTVAELYENLGNINLDSLTYTNSGNIFNFRISFFSKKQDLESNIVKIKEINKRITSMKMESIEKIEGTSDYKYVFIGEIDGR